MRFRREPPLNTLLPEQSILQQNLSALSAFPWIRIVMRVVHLSTSDSGGGAARAAVRLHRRLRDQDTDSQLLVQRKEEDEHTIHGPTSKIARAFALLRPYVDIFPSSWYNRSRKDVWSVGWLRNRTLKRTKQLKPDLVNLHWVGSGFLAVKDLGRFEVPLIWTLHDSWAFTGGCHVPFDCLGYRESCGCCPILSSRTAMDLSRWVWKKKERDWRGADLTLVAPSTWMAERVRLSRLFRNTPVKVIPNGLDLSVYRPIDRHTARDILNLPHDRQIILSGAMRFFESPYKGATQLQGCLERLACQGWNKEPDLLLFGTSMPPKPLSSSFTRRYVGTIHDDVTLALYYSASDVFVCSSIAENLSCTVMESLACGTPVVAFDIGGMSDMIEHKITRVSRTPI